MDWFDLLAVQGTLKSLLQDHSSKASILQVTFPEWRNPTNAKYELRLNFKETKGIEKIWIDEKTDTAYVNLIYGYSSYSSSYGYIKKLNEIAKTFGGTVACIETEEEYEKITANIGQTTICIFEEYDKGFTWINGESIDVISEKFYSATPQAGDFYFAGGAITNGSHMAYAEDGSYCYVYLLEIPNASEKSLLIEDFEKAEEKIRNSDNIYFSGNAILNLINSNDIDRWMTIEAPMDSTGLDYTNFGGNYWGTTNVELIEKHFIDRDDNIQFAQINPGNFLTEAPEDVWPFVVDAGTIVDGEEFPIVGNEEVTFFVEFNRDMDTTIPLRVRFGSYYPYADYEVEGSYVSPRRWEGTMTLTTLIENGTQYFNISNGKAADSFQKLYEDWGRFTFEIDTTEALAMNLQAVATDEGIQLNWFQDDFDTLMGYNVYRSTEEDGYYQKLNDMIIPTDTKEFFDDEVEPGTLYYYNFTVVKTDLTESVPSGKQVIMSKDTMLPDVYHTPVYNAFTGNKVTVSATVTDNIMVDSVKLYYRIAGTEEWESANMGRTNDKFFHSIDQSFVTTAGIEYYIEAFDGTGYAYKGSAEEPYFITVQVAVSDNDKGDVDGDGVITNRDALILLQGINDLYNLSLEEFARADINGDGELNAVEALRILQYVSGKITSVLF